MNFIKDEMGQGAAEYILLFGGVIVIAVAALLMYNNYFKGSSLSSSKDIASVRGSIN
jgi:Flp pilus assembly pilin Flp